MVSFQGRLAAGLRQNGVETTFDLRSSPLDAVLVIGGTRDLLGLWRVRQKGIPIVQRLNGMNWMHRMRHTGLRHYLRSEYGNFILQFIRSRLAGQIIYQSRFSKGWWERVYGPTPVSHRIIYNGVDLEVYTPDGPSTRPMDRCRVLMVEGSLGGGYEWGLETGVQLAAQMASRLPALELVIVGRVSSVLQQAWLARSPVPLTFTGLVSKENIPELDRSAHLLYAADIHAACPNSAIEALACGLPVVAFDTGALAELVTPEAGRVVAFGSDPWQLQPPDIPTLASAAVEVYDHQAQFRAGARRRAEQIFSVHDMVAAYQSALLGN
jgi:glycosyltransferase involved in cell wall biosynthesis